MSDTPKSSRLLRQFSAFVGVGALSTALDYAVFFLAFQLLGLAPVGAALIGYGAGGVLNYVLNRAHVFKTERAHRAAFMRFLAVMGVGFLLTGYAMRVFTDAELTHLPADCRGYLLTLERIGILSPQQREIVIERLLALEAHELDVAQLKWVALMVLSSQPGEELACARMEDLVFDLPEMPH